MCGRLGLDRPPYIEHAASRRDPPIPGTTGFLVRVATDWVAKFDPLIICGSKPPHVEPSNTGRARPWSWSYYDAGRRMMVSSYESYDPWPLHAKRQIIYRGQTTNNKSKLGLHQSAMLSC